MSIMHSHLFLEPRVSRRWRNLKWRPPNCWSVGEWNPLSEVLMFHEESHRWHKVSTLELWFNYTAVIAFSSRRNDEKLSTVRHVFSKGSHNLWRNSFSCHQNSEIVNAMWMLENSYDRSGTRILSQIFLTYWKRTWLTYSSSLNITKIPDISKQ